MTVRRATWVGVLAVFGALAGPMACGKSKSSGESGRGRGGSSNAGGSDSGGRSGGGATGGGIGGTSIGGSNVGGEAGDSVTGGVGGSAGEEGGSAGEGGSGSGCDAPCTATNCCSDVPGLICSNFSMTGVVVEAAVPPVLPATMRLVGEAVRVTYCSSGAREVTLRFDAGQSEPRQLLVVRVDEGGSLTPLPVILEVDSVAANVYESGTYAAIELRPPDHCTPTSLTDRVTANIDASLEVLGGVTHLEGELILGGAVSNLDALDCLTSISGGLQVSGAASLSELELDSLVFIGNGVLVGDNPSLTRASFSRLSSVGMDNNGWSFIFRSMESLSQVALPSLVDVPGKVLFDLIGQAANAPLELGLGRLETVGAGLEFFSVDNLADLDALENLKTIEGALGLAGNLGLIQIDGLANLETVAGGVVLDGNTVLQSANLSSVRTLGESYGISLSCSGSLELTSLDLESVTELPGELRLSSVGSEFAGPLVVDFSSLETVGTSIVIGGSNLADLDGFQGLRSVGDTLVLSDLSALTQIDGLANLEEVGSRIHIGSSASLRSVNLRSLRTFGSFAPQLLDILELPRLEMVDLRSLVETTGSLRIDDSGHTAGAPMTLNVGSLTVAGGLYLQRVSNLSAISGLGALQRVIGELIIDNTALTSLRSLSALETLGALLSIEDNAMLPTCEAWWLRDHLQMNGFDGSVTISGNLSDTCE
jgi:hypothetical protein